MKDFFIELWLVVSVAFWIVIGGLLMVLPCEMWDWFCLLPIFIGFTVSFCFSLNVYLNRQRRIRKQIK
jgi:hypothetical protein